MLDLYLVKLNSVRLRLSDIAFNSCLPHNTTHTPQHATQSKPCPVAGCHVTFPTPELRLRRILSTQHPVEQTYLDVLDNQANQSDYADLVFIHASSANHFEESQGVVRDLNEKVFPHLRRQNRYSFKFFYYDLGGMTQSQLQQLEKTCGCTLKTIPFERLPRRMSKINSYVWKPLLMKMHLAHSQMTFWLDACVRFKTNDLEPILQSVERVGVFTARSNFHMLPHTHPVMLQYFQISPCEVAPFYETETGFVVMKNDAFVRRAIVDSWVACAFSSKCLCPDFDGGDCRRFVECSVSTPRLLNPYEFTCHRYDQSALGTILISLFDLRATGVGLRNVKKNVNQYYYFDK